MFNSKEALKHYCEQKCLFVGISADLRIFVYFLISENVYIIFQWLLDKLLYYRKLENIFSRLLAFLIYKNYCVFN